MKSTRFKTFLQEKNTILSALILTLSVIILGAIAEYLAEYNYPGANITNLGDALWWSATTMTTVGYGDYTPITPLGRIVAVIVMFAGIGIVVTLVGIISQDRVQRMQERLKPKAKGKARVLANETKATIKDKVEGIEKLTEEDFDGLVIMMKSLRLLYLKNLRDVYKCPRCGNDYYSKSKYWSNCGLALLSPSG